MKPRYRFLMTSLAQADQLAVRMGKSRSEIYREALADYVARREPGAVTGALDEVAEELAADRDRFGDEAARRTLERSRMVISQGDVCWASLERSARIGTGFRRPVSSSRDQEFNASRIATAVVVPLTSNLRLAAAPGNVVLSAAGTGLPKDSVANVSQVLSIDRALLEDRAERLAKSELELVLAGIDLVLGRA